MLGGSAHESMGCAHPPGVGRLSLWSQRGVGVHLRGGQLWLLFLLAQLTPFWVSLRESTGDRRLSV